MTDPFCCRFKYPILLLGGHLLFHHRPIHAFAPKKLTRKCPFSFTSAVSDGQIDLFFFPSPNDEDGCYMDPLDLYPSQGAKTFARFLPFLDCDKPDAEEIANSREDEGEADIQCFIVNYGQVESEGATPEVHCTSNVEEFTWFHGYDLDDLVNVKDLPSLSLTECVDGASPRGLPEWECEVQEGVDIVNEDDWDGWGI